MGKYKPVLIIVAGISIALATSIMAYSWLQKKANARGATITAAVAATNIPWGTVLTKTMLKQAPFHKDSISSGYFPDPRSLEGRVLISPVSANELILETRLAPTEIHAGGVAAIISPGKRAMAIKVDKEKGVSGYIHPGNRVDVLVSLNKGERRTSPITKTVLENITVIAVGPEVEKKGKNEKPSAVDVITLEVTSEQGEVLALATTEGKLQLALRNYIDAKGVRTRGATVPSMLAANEPSEKPAVKKQAKSLPKAVPAPAPTPAQISVELIKGSRVSQVKFEGGK